jgi:hypothetical protein
LRAAQETLGITPWFDDVHDHGSAVTFFLHYPTVRDAERARHRLRQQFRELTRSRPGLCLWHIEVIPRKSLPTAEIRRARETRFRKPCRCSARTRHCCSAIAHAYFNRRQSR